MSLCGRWKDKEAIYAAKAAPVMAMIHFLRKLQATEKVTAEFPSGTGPLGVWSRAVRLDCGERKIYPELGLVDKDCKIFTTWIVKFSFAYQESSSSPK